MNHLPNEVSIPPPFPSTALTSAIHEVVAHLSDVDGWLAPLPAELRYDSSDPYAVCLSIGSTSTGTVDWVFARSLLSEGMSRTTGEGDVLVVPRRSRGQNSVSIVLRSPAGAVVLDLAASAITVFLQWASIVVPPGTEGRHIDLDHVVAALMAGSE
ncbi:SsgA family sporulation/cell division regulator [Streptomyces sp. NPDC005426]|uniref:SsgA family sporulation/cell division regulator n=1 Tax=Streptomyces sp. NPDC005426 TaxID=3155344 RepID=UPI00339F38DF